MLYSSCSLQPIRKINQSEACGFTCRGGDGLSWSDSGLDVRGDLLLDDPLARDVLQVLAALLLPPGLLGLLHTFLLTPPPALLAPSLDLGVIVGIRPAALTIKVVNKDLLLLLNDLDVIIFIIQTLY